MSAFVVDKTHIDLLLRVAFEGPGGARERGDNGLSWYFAGDGGRAVRAEMTHGDLDHANEVGAMLMAENVKSYNHRYKVKVDEFEAMFGEKTPYTYERPSYQLTIPEALKAIECYEYQSCEHPGWETSEAHAFCQALYRATAWRLVGTSDAPWSWSQSDIDKRHADDAAARTAGLARIRAKFGEGA